MTDQPTTKEEESAMNTSLRQDIAAVLNHHNVENRSNTPDFILADVMIAALVAFEVGSNQRENWYGEHISLLGDQGEWLTP